MYKESYKGGVKDVKLCKELMVTNFNSTMCEAL